MLLQARPRRNESAHGLGRFLKRLSRRAKRAISHDQLLGIEAHDGPRSMVAIADEGSASAPYSALSR